MIVNFEIKDNHAIIYNRRYADLHNNFYFTGYQYTTDDRKLVLTWIKSSGEWVDEDELLSITFVHSHVSFVHINYDYSKDHRCLGEISFFPSSDRQTNDSLTLQSIPQEGDDIIYIFESGQFIRVNCGEVILKTTSK